MMPWKIPLVKMSQGCITTPIDWQIILYLERQEVKKKKILIIAEETVIFLFDAIYDCWWSFLVEQNWMISPIV